MARSPNSPWGGNRTAIKCCYGCVPPKRYPGCGDHCPEYKEEKAQHTLEKKREKEYKEKNPTLSNYDFDRRK